DLFDDLWSRGKAHQIYVNCFGGDDSHEAVRRKHRPIVRAIKRGEGDAAESAMVAHLREGLSMHHVEDEQEPEASASPP
ncbi:MAG TPA: FCD domain-containing protein, partial [Acidimicrobiia bacterium]|nr:FCD domain-containing protein [Acidimicrobiia bacterium]